MSGPSAHNHDLAAAVAEINRAAAAAALPSSATPVLTTVGDATASSATTTAQGPGNGRGAFIVLEGLDRSGKTTQVKLLESRLAEEGRAVQLMRFPDRTTPTGQIINEYLSSSTTLPDQSIHLLFTANRWESAPTITSLLSQGTTIICDRYYYSGMVYSAAKNNPSLTLPWARSPELGLPRPDLVVFLDLNEEKAKERGGFGEERYETGEMQGRVRSLFWGLKEGVVEVGGEEVRFREESEDLVVVDAGGSVEEVADEIWGVVVPRVEEVRRGEMGDEVRRVS
ncbi:Thymidylate kinase [Cytospora mali]|uniref:Thymidylate kinase n=1 Tax=Cytospora mali TaxID=578113 RepID=A0A194VEW8_CYTMA|nr:Thymidylate kinase [Valsa mali var. pyri (nom. inval.)]